MTDALGLRAVFSVVLPATNSIAEPDMAAALEREVCRVEHEVYAGLGHYAVHLAMGESEFPWVKLVRQWMTAPPDAQTAARQPASSSAG